MFFLSLHFHSRSLSLWSRFTPFHTQFHFAGTGLLCSMTEAAYQRNLLTWLPHTTSGLHLGTIPEQTNPSAVNGRKVLVHTPQHRHPHPLPRGFTCATCIESLKIATEVRAARLIAVCTRLARSHFLLSWATQTNNNKPVRTVAMEARQSMDSPLLHDISLTLGKPMQANLAKTGTSSVDQEKKPKTTLANPSVTVAKPSEPTAKVRFYLLLFVSFARLRVHITFQHHSARAATLRTPSRARRKRNLSRAATLKTPSRASPQSR